MINKKSFVFTISIIFILTFSITAVAQIPVVEFETGEWIQNWLLCGPFHLRKTDRPVPETRHLLGFETDYLQEIGSETNPGIKPDQKFSYNGGSASFTRHKAKGNMVNLDMAISSTDNVLAYAYCEIESPEDRVTVLALGSNDGGRAWLNGELIWDYTGARGLFADDEKIPVFLKKGRNKLLLKVEDRGNDWGFCVRFLSFAPETFVKDVPLFSVVPGTDGQTQLRFHQSESAIDRLFKNVDLQVSSKENQDKILWQSQWPRKKETSVYPQNKSYGEFKLHVDALLTDGNKWTLEIPFVMGVRDDIQLFTNKMAHYRINEFGATGDGKNLDTRAIQAAIDSCSKNGGGTVYFPPGRYLSGSIHLKSDVAIYLDHGATLLASTNDEDFDPYEKLDFENDADHETSFFHFALIWGEDISRIAILGSGTIDGNRSKRGGPKPIALKRCQNVSIKDITILNAPNYAISMLGTDYVNIDGVSILNGYCDGIDPDACHHVRISNCHIDCYDDAIVPKSSFSLGYHRSTEYLTVTNCQLATNCNAFKLGTESGGDFKYITVSNCVMFNRSVGRPPTSGISLETVDGANIDGVTINNISMNNIRVPIFLRLGNRGRDMDEAVPGTLQNVIISNITATGAERSCPITGIPGHNINNVLFDKINITYNGGGTTGQTHVDVPEHISKYPSATMFKELPSYGFYLRHVTGIKMEDIRLSLSSTDLRYALFAADCSEIEIESLGTQLVEDGAAIIALKNIQEAIIRNCNPPEGTDLFLNVSGERSEKITLINNDFQWVAKVFHKDDDVSEKAVKQLNNF